MIGVIQGTRPACWMAAVWTQHNLLMCRFYEQSEQQKVVLRRQASIAVELNLPVVIHSRDSELDIMEELEKVLIVHHSLFL